ncbi:hypothetical protein [Arthrobacter sp. NPDC058127]|uniref:hypothetical protein n=1 Tax=Arthrobacter sp. NPDC058127 TaxID=3346351 RepID=UPI0036E586B0
MATIVLAAAMALSLNACVFDLTAARPLAHGGTPSAPATKPSAIPTASSGIQTRVRSSQELQALLGSLRAPDGVMSTPIGEAAIQDLQDSMAVGPADMTTDPAGCRDLLKAGELVDYRIPTAAAVLGPQENMSVIMASSDDSGYFWQGMYSIGRALGYCPEVTISSGNQQVHSSLKRLSMDLHGSKSFTYVTSITGSGAPIHVLRMVTMSGSLFVTGVHPLPDAQPTDAVIQELSSYVNAIVDHAGDQLPGAPGAKQPTGPATAPADPATPPANPTPPPGTPA